MIAARSKRCGGRWRVPRRAIAAVLGGVAAAFVGLALTATTGRADSATVIVDRQEYAPTTTTQADPCQSSTVEICVGAASDQAVNKAYVHVNISGLPRGAEVSGLMLTLTPAADPAGNADSGEAALDACLLTQPLAAPFDPTKPPAYDCSKGDVHGKLATDGTWKFDLAPLVVIWARSGNTGAAIVPPPGGQPDQLPSPAPSLPGLPAPAPVSTSSWSIAFDKTHTVAVATYAIPAPPTAQPGPGDGGGSVVPPLPPPAFAAPAVVAAPPPITATPTPAPSASPPPVAAALPATVVLTPSLSLRLGWVITATALVALAVAILVVASARELGSEPATFASVGAAVKAARRRVAAPVALLILVALVVFGSVAVPTLTRSSQPAAAPQGALFSAPDHATTITD